MNDYKEDGQDYYEWRRASESRYNSGTQYHQSREVKADWDWQIKLMDQLEKDITQDCKTSKRPPQQFERLEHLMRETIKDMRQGGDIYSQVFSQGSRILSRVLGNNNSTPEYKFDPKSREYSNFLKEARKILPPLPTPTLSPSLSPLNPCKTDLLLYMTKDSLAAKLPSQQKRDFIIEDVKGDEVIPEKEKQILESKSPQIFDKFGNKEAKVIATYPDKDPGTLYITASHTDKEIIAYCHSEERRALIMLYLNLKVIEITFIESPIIAFSIQKKLFTPDSQGRRSMAKTNESTLCNEQMKYKSLYSNNLYNLFPQALAKTILEYVHTCNMGISRR